jgi:GNAT superfamily N-acetyltransferase
LQTANDLVVASMNDLTERHGLGPMASPGPPVFARFCLGEDPAGLWLAEDAGNIVGFALSWVCGELWFLAQLFVSPDRQGQGIGDELMRRTLRQADTANARRRALITFSFNRVSQGLYLRHGLFPRLPIYNFAVAREALPGIGQDGPMQCVPMEPGAAQLQRLAALDGKTLGLRRDSHHKYLGADAATRSFELHAGKEPVGYFYLGADGHIGPLAVTRAALMQPAFATALALAAAGHSAKVSAFIAGANEAALRLAVASGMRIAFPMVLMSDRDFGHWDQYLPRNPGLM